MKRNDIIDMRLFSECVTDVYYLIRLNCDSLRSIYALRAVYPQHYIIKALKVFAPSLR